MAGQVYGSVDHLLGNAGSIANNYNEMFVTIHDFVNTHWTRIASFWGSGGTGLDYHDGVNPAAAQAFAVFRSPGNSMPPMNLAITYTDSVHTGWTIDGSTSPTSFCGLATAARDDGTNPWAGGTDDDGADTVANPVWTVGGASTLFTFDFFNEAGGTRATQKDCVRRVGFNTLSTAGNRVLMHMWLDDDGILILCDTFNASIYPHYNGAYDILAGNTHDDGLPGVCVYDQNGRWFVPDGTLGAYGSTNQEGGALLPLRGSSGLTPQFHLINHLGFEQSSSYQPNRQLDVPGRNMPRIGLVNAAGSLLGRVGHLPTWIRYGWNLPCNSRNNTTPHRAFFGNPATDDHRGVLPWHAGGPPGSNATRAGVQFTWTGP